MYVLLFAMDKRNKSSTNIEMWKGTRKYPFIQLGLYFLESENSFRLVQGIPLTGDMNNFRFLAVSEEGKYRKVFEGGNINLLPFNIHAPLA